MLSKQPRVSFLSQDELKKLCAHYQLPAPTSVEPVSRTWMHINFALRFPAESGLGDLMLRRVVWEPGWDTLHREFAALSVARQNPALPIVDRYQILPDGLIHGRASLSRLLPGTSLNERKGTPEFLDLCEQAGVLMAQLADHRIPHFGTAPNGSVFLPTAASWKEEWRGEVQQWASRARQAGELSKAREVLLTRIEARMEALDEVDAFSLVHGDLHSGNFLVDGDGTATTLTGLIDWDQALAGDPLIDWATCLCAPPAALAALAKGYGHERIRAMLEPNALARLEVYYFTHLLARIGMLSSDLLRVDEGQIRAIGLSIATAQIERGLQPNAVQTLLEGALSGVHGAFDPQPSEQELLYRRIQNRIMSGPPLRADQTNDLLLALAAGQMASIADENIAVQYSKLGQHVVTALGQQSIQYHHTNCVTESHLKNRVFEDIMKRREPGLSTSICLLSGFLELAKSLPGETHPGVWSGLSALIEAGLFVEQHTPPLQGLSRLAHALLGLDAAISADAPSGVIARYGAVLTEFDGIDSSKVEQAMAFVNQGPPPGIPKGAKGKGLMPLLLAMARLESQGRLKVPAGAVLQQLGFVK